MRNLSSVKQQYKIKSGEIKENSSGNAAAGRDGMDGSRHARAVAKEGQLQGHLTKAWHTPLWPKRQSRRYITGKSRTATVTATKAPVHVQPTHSTPRVCWERG